MQDLNKLFLIGRLTRDVGSDEKSFGYLSSGQAKATFSIACNKATKKGNEWTEKAQFFNITLFGRQAEALKPFLRKGRQVSVEAHLDQNVWEKDGVKHNDINIIADNVQLLGNKGDSGNSAPAARKQPVAEEASQGEEFPEDIPF